MFEESELPRIGPNALAVWGRLMVNRYQQCCCARRGQLRRCNHAGPTPSNVKDLVSPGVYYKKGLERVSMEDCASDKCTGRSFKDRLKSLGECVFAETIAAFSATVSLDSRFPR